MKVLIEAINLICWKCGDYSSFRVVEVKITGGTAQIKLCNTCHPRVQR